MHIQTTPIQVIIQHLQITQVRIPITLIQVIRLPLQIIQVIIQITPIQVIVHHLQITQVLIQIIQGLPILQILVIQRIHHMVASLQTLRTTIGIQIQVGQQHLPIIQRG